MASRLRPSRTSVGRPVGEVLSWKGRLTRQLDLLENHRLSYPQRMSQLRKLSRTVSHFPNKIAILALPDRPYELPEGCWSRDPDGFPSISG